MRNERENLTSTEIDKYEATCLAQYITGLKVHDDLDIHDDRRESRIHTQ